MHPDVNFFLQIFANPGEHDIKRMLLSMITTSLYLGLPLLWSGMMAWAGVNIGRALLHRQLHRWRDLLMMQEGREGVSVKQQSQRE